MDDHIVLSPLAHCYSQSCNILSRNTELLMVSVCSPPCLLPPRYKDALSLGECFHAYTYRDNYPLYLLILEDSLQPPSENPP